jgi:long-chain acyl-CoA synthetase
MSVINTVAGTCGNSRNRITAYQGGRKIVYTLDVLDQLAAGLAGHWRSIGLQPGDRVGVLAKNSIEWVLIDLAAIKSGIVTAGFEAGRFQPTAELLERYGLRLLYSDTGSSDHPRILESRRVTELAATASLAAPADIRYGRRDTITLKFTSGSTGEPKGLGASAGSIDASLAAVQGMFEHGAGDNVLVFLPLSLLQQRYWIYSALAYGHDVTLATHEFVFPVAREARPTVIMGVPAFYETVRRRVETMAPEAVGDLGARRRELERTLGSRIRYCWTGSAPASLEVLRFFNDCGMPLYEGYGMNETCIIAKNHRHACRPGSVGQVLPHKRVRIEAGGAIVVGSDDPVNTHYAYCRPGDNERVFLPNGDVRTGDLGYLDDDGFLYVLGRADDVLVLSNGRNVPARPLEDGVKKHPAVADCVLYGAGRPFLVAVVSPADEPADHPAILGHIDRLNEKLHEQEQIRWAVVADRFTVDNGLLSSQHKPKRNEIYGRYRQAIEDAYGVAS